MLTGSTNEERIWNYLTAAGLNVSENLCRTLTILDRLGKLD